MRAFVYEIRFLPGTEQEYLLERVTHVGERQALPYAPDDVNWMALLSRQLSFRFLGKSGSLSVYLEQSRSKDPKRGDKPYWSGYRKAHGVQVKTYLGHDLRIEKLEQASASLWARLREKLGLLEEDPFLTTRFLSDKRKEQESVRHLLDQLQKKDQAIADLRQELTLRDQALVDLKQELAMRDQMIDHLKQELIKKDQMIDHLKQELIKKDQMMTRLRDHSGLQGKRRKPHAKRS